MARTSAHVEPESPLFFGSLSEEQFNAEIEKGLANLIAGKVVPADRVAERIGL